MNTIASDGDQTTIERDVTVNGESFTVSVRMSTELMRFNSPAAHELIESDLAKAVNNEYCRRYGAGQLVRLAPDRYEWSELAAVGG
jgi:hypothetical protein